MTQETSREVTAPSRGPDPAPPAWTAANLWARTRPSLTALAIGSAGGALFFYLNAPLAWLLGAMLATTAAALAGVRIAVPQPLRLGMIAILGVMLGSAFSPETLNRLVEWGASLLVLALALSAMTALAYLIFRRLGGFDPVSAYFSATPGGLSEMALAGESLGADVRIISLVHATRILLVVSLIPLYFRFVEGIVIPAMPPTPADMPPLDLTETGLLFLCAAIGLPLALRLRLPAGPLVGPMTLSALLHLSGVSHVAPPNEIIAVAQVVVGTAIGTRFAGLDPRTFRRAVGLSCLTSVGMVAIGVATTFLAAPLLGIDRSAFLLSVVPGGLAEMSVIALSLQVETAFVSTMHIVRITLVVVLAPLIFQHVRRFIQF